MHQDSFSETFRLAAIGLGHVSLDGRWLRVNPKLCATVGYSEEELTRLTFQEITHPDDLNADLEMFAKLIAGDFNAYSLEKRYIRKDKSLVWIRLHVSIFDDEFDGKLAIAVVENIDERKALERERAKIRSELEERVQKRTSALSLLKRELDGFFDLNLDIMAILEIDGRYRRVNPALCSLLGFESFDLLGSDSVAFIYAEDQSQVREMRALAAKDHLPRYYEARHLTRAGGVRWIAWSEIAVDGEQKCIFATGRDITSQKLQQQRATRTRRAMETRSKLRVLGSMAANMAHEINNPLTVILGEGYQLRKLAQKEVLDTGALARSAESLITMAERITTIVRGLQTAARDSSNDPLIYISFAEIFAQIQPFCRGNVNSSNVELTIEPYDPNLKVFCQPVQLSQILLNLINNGFDAAAAGPPPRKVSLALKASASRLEIRVSDTGHGIAEQIKDKLFQPFVTTKATGQGMGLGLSLSKNMIRLQNGELFLDGCAPKTTFVISIPLRLKTHLYSEI